jgi:hypothetical protein
LRLLKSGVGIVNEEMGLDPSDPLLFRDDSLVGEECQGG